MAAMSGGLFEWLSSGDIIFIGRHCWHYFLVLVVVGVVVVVAIFIFIVLLCIL